MIFNSEPFAILFVLTFICYQFFVQRRWQNAVLIVANVIFYFWSGMLDTALFAWVLMANYLIARRIDERPDWRTAGVAWVGMNIILAGTDSVFRPAFDLITGNAAGFGLGQAAPKIGPHDFLLWNGVALGAAVFYFVLTRLPRKAALIAAIVLNLANLATFKYAEFIFDNISTLISNFGGSWTPPEYNWLLPLGISFYTFQIIAYQVDLYRKHASPPRNFPDFLVFIAFFPQLIAGPILRAHQFLPQLQETRRLTTTGVRLGFLYILWGFIKKVVLGDTLSTFVEPYFSNVPALHTVESWVAAVCFTFQIYFDFSGYSDIAVGLGHMFGFTLTRNFHEPYVSRSPQEFWRRWHVTLSQWLRDYLYITLGGNRGTTFAMYRNLFLTMVIGGLWHGANWTFVAWGAIHGVWLILHRLWMGTAVGKRLSAEGGRLYIALTHVVSIILIVITWVFFRADTLSDAVTMVRTMFVYNGWGNVPPVLVASFVGLSILHVLEHYVFEDLTRAGKIWEKIPSPMRLPAQTFVGAAAWLLVVIFMKEDAPFIYFRF